MEMERKWSGSGELAPGFRCTTRVNKDINGRSLKEAVRRVRTGATRQPPPPTAPPAVHWRVCVCVCV